MGRPWCSLFMQRAMSGLCVAWKPLMAPQAMVMNRQGKTAFGVNASPGSPSQSSGIAGHFTKSITSSAPAMNIREKAKRG